jgi:hypothetical protein
VLKSFLQATAEQPHRAPPFFLGTTVKHFAVQVTLWPWMFECLGDWRAASAQQCSISAVTQQSRSARAVCHCPARWLSEAPIILPSIRTCSSGAASSPDPTSDLLLISLLHILLTFVHLAFSACRQLQLRLPLAPLAFPTGLWPFLPLVPSPPTFAPLSSFAPFQILPPVLALRSPACLGFGPQLELGLSSDFSLPPLFDPVFDATR